MGKVTGINGSVVGKVGNVVFSVSGGENVARAYQPNVSNPNTAAQVDQRARLKLMSQIAAALAPVIVIPKEGLKSSRNLFIKKNFDKSSADNGVAQITYENLQITAGNAALPAIELTRSQQSGIVARLSSRAEASITRVVYIAYVKTSENTLQYMQSIIVENAGSDGTFPGTLLYLEGDVVVFAYGMKDLSAKANAKYADYNAQSGEDIARLAASRNINYNDYQFTQTRGTTLFAGESQSVNVPDGYARVFVTAGAGGSVAGAGVFAIGQQVTVTATPNEGYSFIGWYNNGSDTRLSSDASYSFTLSGTADLVARFRDNNAAEDHILTVRSADSTKGTVTMSPADGNIPAGTSVTLTATPAEDYRFTTWTFVEEGSASEVTIGTSNPLTWIPTGDGEVIGNFQSDDEPGGSDH